ncbi:proteinase inhibitor [Shewanella sp. SHSM-M6]|uniref:Proteinase inhibitor n=2 Tax=Shewanella salipaludis TaxID=2723052 RepID=A0A972FWV4_9GAMM|nr:proteinase inhibitor [Shewanella salipaludis]
MTASQPRPAGIATEPLVRPLPLGMNDTRLITLGPQHAAKGEDGMAQDLFTGELILDSAFEPNQPLKVTLLVTNVQRHAVALRYNSGMTADLWLLDPQGKRLWAWSDDMMFTQALRDTVIQAGGVIKVRFLIPAKALARVKGKGYYLEAYFAGKAQEAQESQQATLAPVRMALTPPH